MHTDKKFQRHAMEQIRVIEWSSLDAEVRIGELMARVPKAPGTRTDIEPINSSDKRLKSDIIRESGFTPMQVSRFETLAAHPEVVAQEKAEARENVGICPHYLV